MARHIIAADARTETRRAGARDRTYRPSAHTSSAPMASTAPVALAMDMAESTNLPEGAARSDLRRGRWRRGDGAKRPYGKRRSPCAGRLRGQEAAITNAAADTGGTRCARGRRAVVGDGATGRC